MEYQEQYVYPIFYRNIEIDDISDAEKTKGTQKEAALQKRKFHLFDMEKFLKKETAYFYFCPFCGNMDTLYHYQKENYPEMSEMLKEALKERLLKQEYSDFEKLPVEWKEILSLTLPVYYAKKKSINVDEFKCTCPRCGKTFSNYERRSLISSYSQRRGERNFRFEDGGNKRIFKYTIKTQENRIILNIIKKKYIIMETHLVFETSSTVYIFHTDTGLSYRMRERLVPSGKAVEKEYPRIMQFSSAFLKSNYFSNDFKNGQLPLLR